MANSETSIWWRNIHNGAVLCQPTIPHLYDWECVVRDYEKGTWRVVTEAVQRPEEVSEKARNERADPTVFKPGPVDDDDYPRTAGLYTDDKPDATSRSDTEPAHVWRNILTGEKVEGVTSPGTNWYLVPSRKSDDPVVMEETPVKGYRKLSQLELDLVNKVKDHAELTRELIEEVKGSHLPREDEVLYGPDLVWVRTAKVNLQQGYMALVRSITRPKTF